MYCDVAVIPELWACIWIQNTGYAAFLTRGNIQIRNACDTQSSVCPNPEMYHIWFVCKSRWNKRARKQTLFFCMRSTTGNFICNNRQCLASIPLGMSYTDNWGPLIRRTRHCRTFSFICWASSVLFQRLLHLDGFWSNFSNEDYTFCFLYQKFLWF